MADNSTQTPPPMTTTTERERETVVDERVVALRAMFPDYDDAILQSVLQSAGGNQDRAVDILLAMSDPSFKPEAEPIPVPAPAPILSQTDLDEQFARQLVLQEQQQQTQLWMQSHPDQTRPSPPGVYQSSRPYNNTTTNQYQSPQQPPAANDFQEQVSKIAESGKKTFANIFSKVKAKIQEFETGRPSTSSSPPPPATASYPTYTTHPSSQQYPQQAWSQPSQQPAYFDPNPNSTSSPSIAPSPAPASLNPNAHTPPLDGYDVSSPPSITPPITTTTQLQREPSPQVPTPSASVPTTTSTPSQGAPASKAIDAGKLGLMPKRPVSLIRDPSSPNPTPVSAGAATHLLDDDDDGDDGLEYAESPFDDEHSHSVPHGHASAK